jgi:hypothetical protein
MTEDVEKWWNERTGMDLTPFFDEYLRHAEIPALLIAPHPELSEIWLRWDADEPGFAMPIRVGDPNNWITVTPTTKGWTKVPWTGLTTQPSWHTGHPFSIDTDHFYVRESWMERFH